MPLHEETFAKWFMPDGDNGPSTVGRVVRLTTTEGLELKSINGIP